ncbi:MAG: hypothetical protein UV35_C0015G0016 [candidate division WWE3 bacterium GW2011_GWB1_42_6]|uniref:Uncharacterized protein n=1 Tax=candidate division WWE3 bacterium GW2011_GWB1_42_6 TaxID=1619115 RepID=A0A0G1AZ98_UNCKA|nr:MAG: hypothetical protein UV35_C0015G0016 [candidate division WWE3 bacterium GW2011_GWB1_42_6]
MTDELQNIISRLEKLEKAVFAQAKDKETNLKGPLNTFNGPKGGILLLIKNSFFKMPHAALEVKEEITKSGYHYSIQAVQTALNRLSDKQGPLNTLKDGKKKVYVKRK